MPRHVARVRVDREVRRQTRHAVSVNPHWNTAQSSTTVASENSSQLAESRAAAKIAKGEPQVRSARRREPSVVGTDPAKNKCARLMHKRAAGK